MKNHKAKLYITLLLLTIISVSCDDYLETSPDDRLELDTLEKAAKVVADSYSMASYAFTDNYTDLVGPTGSQDINGIVQTSGGNSISLQDIQTYTWDNISEIFQDSPTYFWNQTYKGISQTNEVLAIIDNLDGNQKYKNAIKGEALLSRAYSHFMLVNIFGLHYNINTPANLGIPYVLKPETEFLPIYKRNTVIEVYDLVEKDLLDGLALINDEFFIETKKYHFTKKAALAFASRFYLWKKDYASCKRYSDLFLNGNPTLYIKNYDHLNGSNYDERADKYLNPEDESNVLVMQKFSWHQRLWIGFRLNDKGITELLRNPLNIDDERKSSGIWNWDTDARKLVRLREYFKKNNLSSNSGIAYHISIELKGEEVLLNRAEANLFLGNIDAAMADINILARERYFDHEFNDRTILMDFYNTADQTSAVLAVILHERKKEFIDHGLRWFDIKRHYLPVTHTLPVTEGGETFELSARDLRKAVQIPNDAIQFGLTPNPR
jgi:hypothetical protein